MPNAPKFKARTVRVPDELWDEARVLADERGEVMSDIVRRALRRYVKSARKDVYGYPPVD